MGSTLLDRRQFHGLTLSGLGGMIGGRLAWAEEAADPNAVEPLPFVAGSFTIVALPDTQNYCESYPHHYYNQTQWIHANQRQRDIQFVVHLGDITNRNSPEQWQVARKAMDALEGSVPYSLVLGNHDCGPGGDATSRDTLLNDYFSIAGARRQPTFGGAMIENRLDNSFHTFEARGEKFLVLALEWGPRDETVKWADGIAGRHPDHRVLLTTHAYMYFDDTRYDWASQGAQQQWNPHSYATAKLPGGVNDGQQLWDKLASRHENFMMTLNGHVCDDGLGKLTSRGADNNDVHQMLVNYQVQTEGGEGYFRLLEFLPDGQTVQVKCFSPSTGKYKTDAQNQFVLKLQPALKAWG